MKQEREPVAAVGLSENLADGTHDWNVQGRFYMDPSNLIVSILDLLWPTHYLMCLPLSDALVIMKNLA